MNSLNHKKEDAKSYHSKTLLEAQTEYNELIHHRPGEKLDTANIVNPSNQWKKLSDLTKVATVVSGRYASSSSSEGSDFSQGTRLAMQLYSAPAGTVADNVRTTLSNRMAMELNYSIQDYNKQLANCGTEYLNNFGLAGKIKNVRDYEAMYEGYRAMLNKSLNDRGLHTMNIRFNKKQDMIPGINEFLRKNKNLLTPEEIKMLKSMKKLDRAYNLRPEKGRLSSVRNFCFQTFMRYARQTDAGYAISMSYTFYRRARNTFRFGVRAALLASHSIHMTSLLMAKSAAWAAAKAAKYIPQSIKQSQIGGAINKGRQAANNLAIKGKKSRSRIRNAFYKIKRFQRDPFRLRSRAYGFRKKIGNKIYGKLSKTFLGKPLLFMGKTVRFANFIASAIGSLTSMVMSLVSYILSIVFFGIFILVMISLIASILTSIIGVVTAAFDFTSNEDEIRQIALDQIRTCYETQNTSISNIMTDSRYRNVTMQYINIRDNEAYEEEDHKPEIEFIETTNSAEMLSMATVYFDFDLGNASEEEIKKYIRELYNGSHITTIVENEVVYYENVINEDGNEEQIEKKYIDANITLTSYYFNALFECQLVSGSTGILSGTEVSEQVWNYFRSIGFSEAATAGIMGNMFQESGMDPTALQNGRGPAAGICQWEKYNDYSSRWGNLAKYAQSQGKTWTDLQCQLDFLVLELKGGDSTTKRILDRYGGLTALMNTNDVNWAVEVFEKSFERAGKPNMQRRYTQANAYYQMYQGREVVTE